MIKGAIFDMDGTLMDSMGMWDNAGIEFLTNRGITPEEGAVDIVRPLNLKETHEYFVRAYNLDMSLEDFMDEVNSQVEAFYREKVELKTAAKEFLEKLHSRGIPMAIATLTDIRLVETALKHCGIYDYFKGIVTSAMVNVGKTEPDIFRKALEIIGSPKEETVVFEDLFTPVRTAKKDGFRVCAVYDVNADHRKEIDETADLSMADFSDFEGFWEWADK